MQGANEETHRVQGLRILARMIARAYVGRHPNSELHENKKEISEHSMELTGSGENDDSLIN